MLLYIVFLPLLAAASSPGFLLEGGRMLHARNAENFPRRSLVVSTRLSEPYCMMKDSNRKLSGNDRFEGYSVDLMDEISKVAGFNYTLQMVNDGAYGSYNSETKTWNGMIGELLAMEADLAVADLTITSERERVVDFSVPFMTTGISILYYRNMGKATDVYFFLSPFSSDVWIYTIGAYLGMMVLLLLLQRFHSSNKDIEQSFKEDQELPDKLTLFNSMWLFLKNQYFIQRSTSIRVVKGTCKIFTLVMICLYIANLTAILVADHTASEIESVEDLARQSKIKYGALRGGATASFFRDSDVPMYKRMWSSMQNVYPSVFPKSNVEGVERVMEGQGSYAYFMESTSIEYVIARNCQLQQVGSTLNSRAYGVAMPKNSPFRAAINAAILRLEEDGTLHKLKTRWWKEKQGSSCNEDVFEEEETDELTMSNMGGVYLLLLGGLGIACAIAVCEFLFKSRNVSKHERISTRQKPEEIRI